MVSVIVPIYNAEAYLRQCVESVISQSEPDWEMLLVDDGSPDSSGSMADAFAASDPRIKAIHKPNGGLSDARNAGLDAARGQFITFLDADDTLQPTFLATMLATMASTGARLAACTNSRFDSMPPEPPAAPPPPRVMAARKAIELCLYQTDHLDHSACGKLYDARLWKGIRFTTGIGYEDLDIFYKVFMAARRVAFADTPLYCYRRNPESYTSVFSPRRADVLSVTERLTQYMRDMEPSLLPAALDRQLSANFNIFGLMAANGDRWPDMSSTCWNTIRRLRRRSLFDSKVRLKNKLGIIASYAGGQRLLKWLGKKIY